jgi:hypothetical protein
MLQLYYYFHGLLIYVFEMPVPKINNNAHSHFFGHVLEVCGFVGQLVSWSVSLLVVCQLYSCWVFWFIGLL